MIEQGVDGRTASERANPDTRSRFSPLQHYLSSTTDSRLNDVTTLTNHIILNRLEQEGVGHNLSSPSLTSSHVIL
jgi:hypothetical protein